MGLDSLAKPIWLDDTPEGDSALIDLMLSFNIFPYFNDTHNYFIAQWGKSSDDIRVIPISEHADKKSAFKFTVVLCAASMILET